jgi:hypothetical protein
MNRRAESAAETLDEASADAALSVEQALETIDPAAE